MRFYVALALCLAMLLFWQKRAITLPIMLHVVVVMVLVGRALDLYPSDWGKLSSEQNAYLFNHIYDTTKNLTTAFGLLWLYEWWYIGRRRSELNDEW